ncbi:hypothetical protein OSB04_014331 [Centaurea solstitialis]|uniref:SKP1-like protein n=1 Tax=Centaurea solstitialis TaxID=347529 RepID=A0AA38T847_9ASTR|nr:hypothetical protein OSB04_014331 [Centaurea solstitialis]
MSPNLQFFLFIFISISALTTVSSRPIATTPLTKRLVLKSSDGEKFDVELQVAMQSETIRRMIVDDGGVSGEIVLSFRNITGETMAKVVEYCKKHVYYDGATNNVTAMDEMKAFDKEFVNVHYEILFRVFLAANDLKLKNLHDLVGGTIGNMMLGKGPEEIRKMFNINQDSCVDHLAKEEHLRENNWPKFHDTTSLTQDKMTA